MSEKDHSGTTYSEPTDNSAPQGVPDIEYAEFTEMEDSGPPEEGLPAVGPKGINLSISKMTSENKIYAQLKGLEKLVEGQESNPNFMHDLNNQLDGITETGDEMAREAAGYLKGGVRKNINDVNGFHDVMKEMFLRIMERKQPPTAEDMRKYGDIEHKLNDVQQKLEQIMDGINYNSKEHAINNPESSGLGELVDDEQLLIGRDEQLLLGNEGKGNRLGHEDEGNRLRHYSDGPGLG